MHVYIILNICCIILFPGSFQTLFTEKLEDATPNYLVPEGFSRVIGTKKNYIFKNIQILF